MQVHELAMLLVHSVIFIVPNTRSSRIPELQEASVVERNHAWTINES
jgi:hypothetical protein